MERLWKKLGQTSYGRLVQILILGYGAIGGIMAGGLAGAMLGWRYAPTFWGL